MLDVNAYHDTLIYLMVSDLNNEHRAINITYSDTHIMHYFQHLLGSQTVYFSVPSRSQLASVLVSMQIKP